MATYYHADILFFLLLLLLLHGFPCPSHSSGLFNPRLHKAYVALQAWKHSITCDPNLLTSDWDGPHVCNYTGVFCAPAPDDPNELTVASIDLNQGRICGVLPAHLGLLEDLAVFHINSNRFCGGLPETLSKMKLLHELDVSNNDLSGPFPHVALTMESLKFFDIRFNHFCGEVPAMLFEKNLDAIFINDNNFSAAVPANIGHSPVSVLVLANLDLHGCFPRSISKMGDTLYELILINSGLFSCLPENLGKLKKLRVFDISSNKIVGGLPESIGEMESLEQLNVAHNKLSGEIPESIFKLPRLENFTFSDNYFCSEPDNYQNIKRIHDERNCLPDRPLQRSPEECCSFLSEPVLCSLLPEKKDTIPPAKNPLPLH